MARSTMTHADFVRAIQNCGSGAPIDESDDSDAIRQAERIKAVIAARGIDLSTLSAADRHRVVVAAHAAA